MNKLNPTDFSTYSSYYKRVIDHALPTYITGLTSPSIIKDAMIYSLSAGGKRIRPLLLFATLRAFGKEEEIGLPIACAVEMIHTYSLIHDDLPSMDNDDLRRGKPTNHKVYGEAIAILAGDGLLTHSFHLISNMSHPLVTSEMKLALISLLSKSAGPEGMVGGQVADMEGENKNLPLHELEYIHIHKTGKLLAFCILAGGILSSAEEHQLAKLEEFALHVGLAFQIQDDILDIEGNEEMLGKPVGSDVHNQKTTYPSLLTMQGAKEKLQYHIDEAVRSLHDVGVNHDYLEEICNMIASRNH
ncbi:polyprenyl synthetase family protein [Bacillus timonensis]|nr:polyprenyl synthetase family protein [Bacillus timonensis]